MAKLTILTKNTVAKSFMKGASLGIAAAMFYGGFLAINDWNDDKKYHNRLATVEDSIKKAVSNEDYDTAISTLKRVDAKNILKPEDEVRLESYIKRMSADYVRDQEKAKKNQVIDDKKLALETKFDVAFADNDSANSMAVVKTMRESGIFDDKFLDYMSTQAKGITEEGLMAELRDTDISERTPVAEKYLKIYPKGKYKNDAIEALITGELSKLSTYINQKASFDQAFSQLQNLNSVLKKYSSERVKIPGVIDTEEFSKSTDIYLENLLGIGDKLVKGSTIKTIFVSNEVTNYKDDYVGDRNKAIPLGSVGNVVNFDEDEVYVKFSGMEEPKWGKDWNSCLPYWNESGRKDVAAFDPKELITITSLNDVQKNTFRLELDKFKKSFEAYE